MSCGRSTFLTSTAATFTPHGLVLVDDAGQLLVDLLGGGEEIVHLLLAEHARSVVCAIWEVA
jgi:hypothetical protein